MEKQFITASLVNLLIHLIYALAAFFIAMMGLKWVDRVFLKSLSIDDELKKGNLAVAIFTGSILVFIALIVCFGLKA